MKITGRYTGPFDITASLLYLFVKLLCQVECIVVWNITIIIFAKDEIKTKYEDCNAVIAVEDIQRRLCLCPEVLANFQHCVLMTVNRSRPPWHILSKQFCCKGDK